MSDNLVLHRKFLISRMNTEQKIIDYYAVYQELWDEDPETVFYSHNQYIRYYSSYQGIITTVCTIDKSLIATTRLTKQQSSPHTVVKSFNVYSNAFVEFYADVAKHLKYFPYLEDVSGDMHGISNGSSLQYHLVFETAEDAALTGLI